MSEDQVAQDRRQYRPAYSEQEQDEISLIDLYLVLVKGKKILFATMIFVVLAAVAYLLLVTKVYQVTAMLLEPTADQLVLTNTNVVNPNIDVKQTKFLFEPKDIFEQYKVELKSNETWNLFVEAHPDSFGKNKTPDSEIVSEHNPLVIATDKEYPGPHMLIEYDSDDKDQASDILTQYLGFARLQFVESLINQHKQKIEQKIANLEFNIKSSRAQAKIKREDEIARLENDYAIAKKLNIQENRMLAVQDKSSLTVVTSNMDIPRYMRGTRVLAAELDALKNRPSDDAFIEGLRDWQQEVSRLKQIQFAPKQFQPFTLDGAVNKPDSPIKPKKTLVLALSIVLGLFLGVFAVFFFEFAKKARSAG